MKTTEPIPTLALDDLLSMAASAIEDLLEHTDPNTSYYSGVWADVPGKLRAAAMLQAGNSPVIPDSSASMLRRWLVFGRGMQNAGSQLPHNLIAETEEMLAAAHCIIPMISDRWVPVSERVPTKQDGSVFLTWNGQYIGKELFLMGSFQCLKPEIITHWMPLPADPQEVNHG